MQQVSLVLPHSHTRSPEKKHPFQQVELPEVYSPKQALKERKKESFMLFAGETPLKYCHKANYNVLKKYIAPLSQST